MRCVDAMWSGRWHVASYTAVTCPFRQPMPNLKARHCWSARTSFHHVRCFGGGSHEAGLCGSKLWWSRCLWLQVEVSNHEKWQKTCAMPAMPFRLSMHMGRTGEGHDIHYIHIISYHIIIIIFIQHTYIQSVTYSYIQTVELQEDMDSRLCLL